jgi:hypothetical protein
MSKSEQERTENTREALRVMLGIAGDDRLDWTLFDAKDQRLAHILETTWEKLEATQCVERVQWDYRLTAHGWVMALEAAGRLCDAEMKEDLGRICAALKRRCEIGGRHRDATTVQELAQETGSSEEWIYNIVEGHLIRICLKRVDCEWEPGDQNKNHVMIPAQFGLPL